MVNGFKNLSLTFWLVSCFKCAKYFFKEWVILMRIHCLKENSKDSNLTALVSFLRVSASKMHKVDFCGIIIAFNSVLRRRMEVELKRLEFATLSLSVPEVQNTTVWFDVDLPRIVHCWRFTIFVDLLWFLVLFGHVTSEINVQIFTIPLHCPVTEVDRRLLSALFTKGHFFSPVGTHFPVIGRASKCSGCDVCTCSKERSHLNRFYFNN